MKSLLITAAAFGALAAGGLALSANAFAVPIGGSSADVAVNVLEAEGYTVRINQSVDVPLSQCTVTNVSGLRGTEDNDTLHDRSRLNVAFLDVSCTPHS